MTGQVFPGTAAAADDLARRHGFTVLASGDRWQSDDFTIERTLGKTGRVMFAVYQDGARFAYYRGYDFGDAADHVRRHRAMAVLGTRGVYAGRRMRDHTILVSRPDGTSLPLEPSLGIRNHSPTGFEWGYLGAGPAQLALAILYDATADVVTATTYYQQFKADRIASITGDAWSILLVRVLGWLADRGSVRAQTLLQRHSAGPQPDYGAPGPPIEPVPVAAYFVSAVDDAGNAIGWRSAATLTGACTVAADCAGVVQRTTPDGTTTYTCESTDPGADDWHATVLDALRAVGGGPA